MRHSNWIYRFLLCAFIAAGFGLGQVAAPALAATQKLTVDNDGADCPHADASTIADALTMAAASNVTITVCSGTYYTGPLLISNKVNFKLLAKKGVVLVPDTIPFAAELITVANSTNVTVQGFTIDGLGSIDDTGNHTAIYFYEASGTVTRNSISNWFNINYPGVRNAAGIWITGSGGGKVTVSRNTLDSMDYLGIMARSSGTVSITGNRITASLPPGPVFATAIQVQEGMAGSITGNRISTNLVPPSGSGFTGITLSGVSGMKVSGNSVMGANKGIQLAAMAGYATGNNIVTGNKINEVNYGIWFEAHATTESVNADSNLVTKNMIANKTAQGYWGFAFLVAGTDFPTTVYASLDNETVKGNTVTSFGELNHTVVDSFGALSGVFAPNKYKP